MLKNTWGMSTWDDDVIRGKKEKKKYAKKGRKRKQSKCKKGKIYGVKKDA